MPQAMSFQLFYMPSPSTSSTVIRLLAITLSLCLVALIVENTELQLPFTTRTGSFRTKEMSSPEEDPYNGLKPIPDFSNGGVVLFFHVAKTGGTTVRNNFAQAFDHVRLKTVFNYSEWYHTAHAAEMLLTKNVTTVNGRPILFIELHGLRSPGLPMIHDTIQHFKQLAKTHDTSFFSFTLLREPISFAVSNFNFFFAEPCSFQRCFSALYKPTEKNLKLTARPNYQCLLCAANHPDIFMYKNFTRVNDQICNETWDTMVQDFDWIGTTEGLSKETLPLLTQMLAKNTSAAEALGRFNKVDDKKEHALHAKDLSAKTVQFLNNVSRLDQDLYNKILANYPLEMWTIADR